jgi:hypothetical protein
MNSHTSQKPNTPPVSKACRQCREHLADLLLDASAAPATARGHMAACDACTAELTSLQATMHSLDVWQTPELSPFFDTRLKARLREEIAAEPESFMERLRSFLLYSTGRQLRPAVAGACALVLALSGGTFLLLPHSTHTVVQPSATVNDLRVLDNNASALQQMDQLLNDDSSDTQTTQPAS